MSSSFRNSDVTATCLKDASLKQVLRFRTAPESDTTGWVRRAPFPSEDAAVAAAIDSPGGSEPGGRRDISRPGKACSRAATWKLHRSVPVRPCPACTSSATITPPQRPRAPGRLGQEPPRRRQDAVCGERWVQVDSAAKPLSPSAAAASSTWAAYRSAVMLLASRPPCLRRGQRLFAERGRLMRRWSAERLRPDGIPGLTAPVWYLTGCPARGAGGMSWLATRPGGPSAFWSRDTDREPGSVTVSRLCAFAAAPRPDRAPPGR